MLRKPTTYAKPLPTIQIHGRTETRARWFATYRSQVNGTLIKEDGLWFATVDGYDERLCGGAGKSARAAATEALDEWEAYVHTSHQGA